jgi:4-amino-4-deoxy-L-arabinose transferase-like glycosyltransferase
MQRLHLPSRTVLLHAVMLLAMALPYCINLGKSSLWDANEAFYAETPREMMVTGEYISPLFNFRWRIDKPPLTYYVILLSYKLFGVNEFAVRFPGALAAIGLILFSYATARLLFGLRAALVAAGITAATARIFILARRLPIDILLLFFLAGALFFIMRGVQKKERLSWVLAYLFCALGFLTKGPVGAVIPAGALILWMLWSRRSAISVYLSDGCLIFALLVLPWYVLIYLQHGWAYIAPFFLKDNLGRFTTIALGPSRSPFYYFSIFLTDFFPWSFLALAVFYRLWRSRKEEAPLKSLSFGLPLIWCMLTFCLFSISKNKQEYYIAPMYPAAAIVLSGFFSKMRPLKNSGRIGIGDRDREPEMHETVRGTAPARQQTWWIVPYSLIALILFGVSLLMPYIIASFMPDSRMLLRYTPSLLLIASSAALALCVLRRKFTHCFPALAVPLWAVFFFGALFYIPAFESVRPIKGFCKDIEMQWRGNDEAGYFRAAAPSMVYYLRKPIFEESSYKRMMCRFQLNKRIFCIISEKDYSYFTNKGLKIFILDRHSPFAIRLGAMLDSGRTSGEDLLLVCNRLPAQPGSNEGHPPL